jgi:cobalt/nickel transport system permease protein
MHMADALLSPAVGATLWFASGAVLAGCARRVQRSDQDHLVALMGVLGAFVFSAQMINFTIPLTGSSGHIGGGLLLSILLGPYAAFLVIASVLTVQALVFADGGLLALGANLFNLGFIPCFVGCLLVYRPLVGAEPLKATRRKLGSVAVLAAVIGLQLGALGVVLETAASGVSALPVGTFLLLMQPIHLAIGLVEGLATASIVLFLRDARPDLFPSAGDTGASPHLFHEMSIRPLLLGIGAVTALTAGLLTWFASAKPDGLEWSLAHASASVQSTEDKPLEVWPAIDVNESVAGLLGAGTTLCLVAGVAYLLRRRHSAP